LLSLVSKIRGTQLKVKTPATTFTETPFPQMNCNVKERPWHLQEKEHAM